MSQLSQLDVIIAARDEAAKMLQASADAADGAKVEMEVSQFRRLAALLATTADAVGDGADRFDAPIDGIHFWVPLAQLEAERATLAQVREERDRAAMQQRFDRLVF